MLMRATSEGIHSSINLSNFELNDIPYLPHGAHSTEIWVLAPTGYGFCGDRIWVLSQQHMGLFGAHCGGYRKAIWGLPHTSRENMTVQTTLLHTQTWSATNVFVTLHTEIKYQTDNY